MAVRKWMDIERYRKREVKGKRGKGKKVGVKRKGREERDNGGGAQKKREG